MRRLRFTRLESAAPADSSPPSLTAWTRTVQINGARIEQEPQAQHGVTQAFAQLRVLDDLSGTTMRACHDRTQTIIVRSIRDPAVAQAVPVQQARLMQLGQRSIDRDATAN